MRQQSTFFFCAVLTCLQAASVSGADAPAASYGISVKRFGAVGDGKAKDTAALQNAIDAAHEAGGG